MKYNNLYSVKKFRNTSFIIKNKNRYKFINY